MNKLFLLRDRCTLCGICAGVCPFDALEISNVEVTVKAEACVLCEICVRKCPTEALYISNGV